MKYSQLWKLWNHLLASNSSMDLLKNIAIFVICTVVVLTSLNPPKFSTNYIKRLIRIFYFLINRIHTMNATLNLIMKLFVVFLKTLRRHPSYAKTQTVEIVLIVLFWRNFNDTGLMFSVVMVLVIHAWFQRHWWMPDIWSHVKIYVFIWNLTLWWQNLFLNATKLLPTSRVLY